MPGRHLLADPNKNLYISIKYEISRTFWEECWVENCQKKKNSRNIDVGRSNNLPEQHTSPPMPTMRESLNTSATLSSSQHSEVSEAEVTSSLIDIARG